MNAAELDTEKWQTTTRNKDASKQAIWCLLQAETLERQNRKHRKHSNTWKCDEMEAHTPETCINDKQIDTTKRYLRQLWKDISESTDRLFFIRRHKEGRLRAKWHLVQVDLQEMNQRLAKQQGTYHVQYYIRHHIQSKT
jgi:hypothetical protein